MTNITKIVLTGGPCAGKTTALARVNEHFSSMGYQVFTLPEVPTLFSTAGFNFLTDNRSFHYQAEKAVLRLQMEMEDRFVEMCSACDKPVIIVCDRGAMDISAYLTPDLWQAIMDEEGTNTVQLRDSRYDAVLHLVSAANGAEKFYTTATNQHRSETIEQARELDMKVSSAWTGHPHLRIIGNEEDFENKIRSVLTEISSLLGLPAPIDEERKYIVEVVGEIPGYIESEITQTYLLSEPGTEIRLRKRGWQGNYVYSQNTKKQVSDTERIETERQISPRQYVSLLPQADPSRQVIHKIRKNFVWEGQYFELDSYLQPALNLNILELEGTSKSDEVSFPPFLKVVADITGSTDYYNYNIAKKE